MQKTTKQHLLRLFKFSIIMTFVGLIFGLYGREITRPLMKVVELDRQVWIQQWVMMLHGHAFFYGLVIPMTMISVTYIFRESVEKDEKAFRTLGLAFLLYALGAILTLSLSLYKGTSYVLQIASNPVITMEMVDEGLFGGSVMVRSLLFTIAHPLYAVGLCWYFLRVKKSIKNDPD